MAKKSEATIAKEAALKAEIAALRTSLQMSMPINLSIPHLGRKALTSNVNLVKRRIRMTPTQTAWLLNVKAELHKALPYQTYSINTGFVAGAGLEPHVLTCEKVRIGVSVYSTQQQITFKNLGLAVTMIPGVMGPAYYAVSQPLTSEAYAISWPDELGNAVWYMHRFTCYGKAILKDADPETPDIITENLKGLRDWNVVAEYIRFKGQYGGKVPRDQVCQLIRAISLTESNEELQKMGTAT